MTDCNTLISVEDQQNGKLDAGSLSEAVSSDNPTYTTRLNKTKKTMQGINDDAQAALDDLQTQADNILYSVGFINAGLFSVPDSVDSNQETLTFVDVGSVGEEWAVTSATYPYTPNTTSPYTDTNGGVWRNVTLEARKTVARSLNVKDSQVIYHDDTNTLLDDVLYIYDKSANQKTWRVPVLDSVGKTIVTVIGNQLTTTGGTGSNTYTLTGSMQYSFSSYSDMLASGLSFSVGDKNATGGTTWLVTDEITNSQLSNSLYVKPITKVFVRDFGYVFDLAPALESAIDAVSGVSATITLEGVSEYTQQTTVTKTVTGNLFIDLADANITCSAGFIDLTQATSKKKINIKLGTFIADGVATGDCIKLTFPDEASNQFRTAKIGGVLIEQDPDTLTNYFTSGITLTHAWKFLISDCNIRGATNTTAMTHNIKISGQSTDGEIRNTYGYFADKGFHGDGKSEGIKITGSYFIYVNRGIEYIASQKIPALYLTDVHVNALTDGIYIDNIDQQLWKGVLVYVRNEAVGTWRGVRLFNCANCQLNGVTVAGDNVTVAKNAFQLENVNNCTFDGILMINPKGKILEDPDCGSNTYTNIKVQSDLDAARKFIESGRLTGKSFFASYQKVSTTFNLVTTRSINNVTWTSIAFDSTSEAYSETGLTYFKASLTNATQPIYIGASKYRAWVQFDSNVTGVRQARLITGLGVVLATISGSPDGSGELYIESSPINAAADTSVRLEVRQASGGALDVIDAYLVGEQV